MSGIYTEIADIKYAKPIVKNKQENHTTPYIGSNSQAGTTLNKNISRTTINAITNCDIKAEASGISGNTRTGKDILFIR